MLSVDSVMNGLKCDVTMSRGRYEELIIAEHFANCMKELIYERAEKYSDINHLEVRFLRDFFFQEELEDEK